MGEGVRPFRRVLVANRGEIAVRVIRGARDLGYETVAVYSEADRGAMHVGLADRAVCIGGAASAESYLSMDAILDAAKRSGADAIHPGYGFLSENPDFARACHAAGLVFIGPPPEAIAVMGDKARAKARMDEAGVPTVPGYWGEDQTDANLLAQAETVGFPLLVKAVSGGGGRGMRRVVEAAELPEALGGARREAERSFGDGTLMLERFVGDARHIEVQVFADAHGNVVHLGERDCTAQRRRQKVIEEAPSPVVGEELRARMGRDAVAAAAAIGYVGAGTVEFIVGPDLSYWFLEMNTRLQVEHPVTEMVTGVDLVAWQLRVASGDPLPLNQGEITLRGHAIEARLYAEDPYVGFEPQAGAILRFRPEAVTGRPGVRVDTGVCEGDRVTPFYDNMVAKIIAHGSNRREAIRRLVLALRDAPLVGLATNQRFLADLLKSPDFDEARLDTTTLDRWVEECAEILVAPEPDATTWAVAAAVLAQGAGAGEGFRGSGTVAFDVSLRHRDELRRLRVQRARAGVFAVQVEDETITLEDFATHGEDLHYVRGGVDHRVRAIQLDGVVHLACGHDTFCFTERSPYPEEDVAVDPRRITSPVAGTVIVVSVAEGDSVVAGQVVAVIDAMKMETRLEALCDGRVSDIRAQVGDQVEAGVLLVELDPEGEGTGGDAAVSEETP